MLSYGPFTGSIQVLLFILGLLLPLGLWAVKTKTTENGKTPFHQREFLPAISAWAWMALAAAALFLRFWKIDSLFLWPTGDEGLIGAAALKLSQKWDWRFFYTVGQNPPAFVWLCAGFFKWIPSSFFDLWGPASLVSALTVIFGVMTVRSFSSKSFALVFGFLLAFSYWPLYLGRRCLPAVTVPLGELLLVFCLARFLQSDDSNRIRRAFTLGISAGLQSFTYVAWPVVTLAGGAAFLTGILGLRQFKGRVIAGFTSGAALALSPFVLAVLREGYGQHVSNLSLWSGWFHDRNLVSNVLVYLRALFWNLSDQPSGVLSGEGGLFNPLTDSFLFLGSIELLRFRRQRFFRLAGFVLIFFMLPGFFSLNLQTFRVIQALPLLLGVAALGIGSWLRLLQGTRHWILLAVLLALSTGGDFERLGQPYRDVAQDTGPFLSTGKSLARYRAFGILEKLEQTEGPGFVLGEWDIPADRTMEVATYFFNAALDHKLDPGRIRWAALITDQHYRPFLEKRFPQAQWQLLDSDLPKDSHRMLGVIPVNPEDEAVLRRWAEADRAFRDLNWGIDHIYDRDCLDRINRDILADYPLIQGDPFLESAYWEKAAYFYYYDSGHYPEHLRALQLAVGRGYPAAHLYAELAELYTLGGQSALAQKASRNAR